MLAVPTEARLTVLDLPGSSGIYYGHYWRSLSPAAKPTAFPQQTQKHIFTSSEYLVSQALPALAAERDNLESGYSENNIIEI